MINEKIFDEQIEGILNKIKSTECRKDETRRIFQNYIKAVIKETPEDKLNSLKFPCEFCMRCIFEKLSSAPKINEFKFMDFLVKEAVEKTYRDTSTNKFISQVIGNNFKFKCGVCEGNSCFYIEQ
jgi:hypothetical protein